MALVRDQLKLAQIDMPAFDPAELAVSTGKTRRRGVGETKREEVRFLILSGVPHAEVVRRSGVSGGTVSVIRQALKREIRLYRNTEADSSADACVPTLSSFDSETASQPLENIGGARSL